jgi:hypothetical protein
VSVPCRLVVTDDKSGGLKQDLVHHDVKHKANQEGEKLVVSHEHTTSTAQESLLDA